MANKSKTCSDDDLLTMPNSDSESDSDSVKVVATIEKKTPISAKTRLQRKTMQNEESGRANRATASPSNRTRIGSPSTISVSRGKGSLRLKLRRSTEQSMYKIQNKTPEKPANNHSTRRSRSTSSDASTKSPAGGRARNSIKGGIKPIQETSENESLIESPPRSGRSRRPPVKLASYDYSPLPTSSNSDNSTRSSIKLRKRQPINYNESSLQESLNSTPTRGKKKQDLVSSMEDRETFVVNNKGITDAGSAVIASTSTNLQKENPKNTQLSDSDAESDTQRTNLAAKRERLRKTVKFYSGTDHNKENMPKTSRRFPIRPTKVTRPRAISTGKNENTSIPIIDLSSLPDSPLIDKSTAPTKTPTEHTSSDESNSDSDETYMSNVSGSSNSRTPSVESFIRMRDELILEADAQAKAAEVVEKPKNIAPAKGEKSKAAQPVRVAKNTVPNSDNSRTPGPAINNTNNTRKRAAALKAHKSRRNLEMKTSDSNSSNSSAESDEEPMQKMKKNVKSAQETKTKALVERHVSNYCIPSTPKSLSRIKYKTLTPSIGNRQNAASKPSTPLQNARARLHVGAVPKSLPCREEEFNSIFSYLKGKLLDKTGGCIYVCGVPGTGKTATVNEVIRCLQKLADEQELEPFDFVAINALKLTDMRHAYVHILKGLNGNTCAWGDALKLLETEFKFPSRRTTILLVDEFDYVCKGDQRVAYNLLSWPTIKDSNLVVITIANRMDLPERLLLPRVSSRIGYTRVTFQPYNHHQLLEIVVARLKGFDSFRSEAIQLVARKVSAVSGDARRALDICRRAVELTELRKESTISLEDVTQAISEMIASPKVRAIQSCSDHEKLFLLAVAAEIQKTSIDEVVFKDVYIQMQSLCAFEGIRKTNVSETLELCQRLAASRILICKHFRVDIAQRILLNVSIDDIYYAIKPSQD